MDWNIFKRFQKKEKKNVDQTNFDPLPKPLDLDPPMSLDSLNLESDSLYLFIDRWYYMLKRFQTLNKKLKSVRLKRNSQIREQHKNNSQLASKSQSASSDNLPIIYNQHNYIPPNNPDSNYAMVPYQEKEWESGPDWRDILQFIFLFPMEIWKINSSGDTRRNWFQNRLMDLIRLIISVLTILMYLLVAGAITMLISYAVESACLQLEKLREKRKKWLAEIQGQSETFEPKERSEFESEEDYESYYDWLDEYRRGIRPSKQSVRKKKSKNFWKKHFGFLTSIIKISRGGALIPLHDVDMYSFTKNDKEFILMTMSPECYILKLEKYRQEMKSIVSELKDVTSKKRKMVDFRVPKPVLPTFKFSNEFLAVLLSISSILGSNSVPLKSPNSFRYPIARERIVAATREQNWNQNIIRTIEKQKEPLVANQHKQSEPTKISKIRKETRKWNRRIKTIQDLPALKDTDFTEEILEGQPSSKLPSIKIKNQ